MSPAVCQEITVVYLTYAPAPGPPAGHEAGRPLAAHVEAILNRQTGIARQRLGDDDAVVFGPHQGGDEHPARAVRMAMEIQAALAEANPPVAARIGVHTGPAAAPGEARLEDLNFARRLSGAASNGGVLVSQATYGRVYGMIDAQVMAPITAGRGPDKVQTYLALRVRPSLLARTLRGVEQPESQMVGRSAELDALKSVLRAAADQRDCQVLFIVGDAGIGKSRLLREFQRWLQSVPEYRVLLFSGRAEPDATGQPFSLIRDVFRSRFEILDSDSASVAQRKFDDGVARLLVGSGIASRSNPNKIGRMLGLGFSGDAPEPAFLHEAQSARQQIFQDLEEFFVALAAGGHNGPEAGPSRKTAVLLALDDLHWSDDDSLDLLAHFARSGPAAPLMILALGRPALLDRRPAWSESLPRHALLELKPLSHRESEMLIDTILSQAPPIPTAIRETILADAGGHPFYIEEIIKVLTEKNIISHDASAWQFDARRLANVPASANLRGLLRARLDSLPAPERGVLQSAAVIGHVFWDCALESVGRALARPENGHGSPSNVATPEALASLCRKELIHRRESSGFAGMVEYDFKHELLREVAVETLSRKARREYHAEAARWFAGQSGDRAREFAALVAVHFEQAGKLTEAAEWYGRAGEQAWSSFAPAAAIDHFHKAIHLFGSAPENRPGGGRLAWQEGLSNALSMTGRFSEALKSFAQVCALAEASGDLAAQTRAWNGIAYLHERCADYAASVAAAERAQILARSAGIQGGDELIRATYLKGWAFYRRGDAQAVLELATQTLALCAATGKRSWMANGFKLQGVANLQLGRCAEADGYFEKGLALCLEADDRYGTGAMFSNLGESARLRGDYLRAIELYLKALAGAREMGDRSSEMVYLSNLAGARLGLNQFAEAEADLRQAIAITGMPKSCTLAETYSFLAQACLGQSKLPEALVAARRAVAIGQETGNHYELAGSWRTLGQVLAAIRAASQRGGASVPSPLPSEEVERCFAESVRLYETIGAANEKARTLQIWTACGCSRGGSGNH
jgi:tetratricopeptide (TPR) repeat protein